MKHASHSRHTLITSSHDRKSSGSSRSSRSEAPEKSRSSNMKCIVTVGIILPILAAIIGVVAWAVSSDFLQLGGSKGKIHRSSYQGGHVSRFHDDLTPLFQERNDHILDDGKVSIGSSVSKDILGVDTLNENDEENMNRGQNIIPDLVSSHELEADKKDPLYVVHYVPQKMQDEHSTNAPTTPSPDILTKILSASKGTSKGTPQFVVFAPVPEDLMGKSSNDESHFDERGEYYEDETEPRASAKRVRIKKKRKNLKNASFGGDERISDISGRQPRYRDQGQAVPRNGAYYPDFEPSEENQDFPTYDDAQYHHQGKFGARQQMQHNQMNQMGSNQMGAHQMGSHQMNQQPMQMPQQPMQMPQHPMQMPQQPMQMPQQPMQMPQKPMAGNHMQNPVCCVMQQGQMQPQQQQRPPPQPQPQPQPQGGQNHDADRYGNMAPGGVTISVGNRHGLPISPLGVLGHILKPLLPHSAFDLKKKVFFGVQLENGFGFGNRGGGGAPTNNNAMQGGYGGGGGQGGGGGMAMPAPGMTFHTG